MNQPPKNSQLDKVKDKVIPPPASEPGVTDTPGPVKPEPEKKGRGRPKGSIKSPKIDPIEQAKLNTILPLIKANKEKVVKALCTTPGEIIKSYYRTKKSPQEFTPYEKLWSFSKEDLAVFDLWGNLILDLYLPDLVKHFKVLVLIIGLGNITGVYIGKYIQSAKLSEPVKNVK